MAESLEELKNTYTEKINVMQVQLDNVKKNS